MHGQWLRLLWSAAIIVLVLNFIVYGMVLSEYLHLMQTGFTGLWCTDCSINPAANGIKIDVLPNSPAQNAGIETGDILKSIDGEPPNAPFYGTVGDPGTYGRAGEPVTLQMESGEITLVRETGWYLRTAGLRMMGASEGLAMVFALTVEAIMIGGFTGTAVFIARKRPDDWLIVLVSLLLVMGGIIHAPSFADLYTEGFAAADKSLLIILYSDSVRAAALLFLFVFPDGRLLPRSGAVISLVYLAWRVLDSVALAPIWGLAGYSVDLLFWIGGFAAQIVRYRRVSTPEQQQQTKWVIYGLAVTIIIRFAFVLMLAFVPALNPLKIGTETSFIFTGLFDTIARLAALAVPLSMLFALLRYRLWDINYVINRSLVYGGSTTMLAAVLVGGFFVFQAVLERLLGGEQEMMAGAISAAVTVGLFTPVQRQLRRAVDKRLFGIQISYAAHRPREAVAISQPSLINIEPYQNMQLIGRGGMAEVYRAYHPSLNRDVAIKVLPVSLAGQSDYARRFEREARLLANLKHPNIVQIFDYGHAAETSYIVMEHIHGQDLSNLLADGPMALERVYAIMQNVCDALDYAHAQGLVHRDIKPSNVMLEPITTSSSSTGSERAVLMDFGIARVIASTTNLTTTGVLGTLDYIAPEQIQGAANIDFRADLYSLGVMLYQMLTGQLPFQKTNPAQIILAHLQQPPPDPRLVRPNLPDAAASTALRALQKDPSRRFGSAGAMATALRTSSTLF